MAHHLLLAAATILLTLFFLSPPTAADSVVLDIDGNPVEAGSQYYVLTRGTRGAGRGGLTAAPLGGLCPLYVGQHRSWTQQGSPVTFFPANPSQKYITQSSDVNIAFGLNPICRNLGVWQLGYSFSGVPYVTTNGVIGNPGAETFTNWFKIEHAFGPESYKIVYCFLVPAPWYSRMSPYEYCEQLDATIPGPSDLAMLSLVPIDKPLPFFGFVFKKVTSTPPPSPIAPPPTTPPSPTAPVPAPTATIGYSSY
ncbi:hypothetical protein SOVF_138580 [Spinacia oleracea]|uniref:21 kDa seed protein-like n=1 Tax=Spinacia oleracea TaxID=3562 RepID=A0A9R0J2F5_SPIOL|nr:21 kDa seed protein-like [Spinacia oleracea]KNA11067.1 hypothetical protein SOVF_138580 [Spinacia oleracea]